MDTCNESRLSGIHSCWSVEVLTESTPLLQAPGLTASRLVGASDVILNTKGTRVWKNVVTVACAMGIYAISLNLVNDLQKSLNNLEEGLGDTSLIVKYTTIIVTSLVANTLLIRVLGAKWALVSGVAFFTLFAVSRFFPTWAMLIPMSAVAGVGGALIWTSSSSYLAQMAAHHAAITGRSEDGVKALFFGVKGLASYASVALGCVAASILMLADSDIPGNEELGAEAAMSSTPSWASVKNVVADYCIEDFGDGACLNTNNTLRRLQKQTLESGISEVYLCAFCVVAGLVAVMLLAVVMDPLPSRILTEWMGALRNEHKYNQEELEEADGSNRCGLLLATVMLWRRPQQLLLVPTSFVYGYQEAFWRVEFSKVYITCALGAQFVGYLAICHSLASMVSSFASGWIGSRRLRLMAFPMIAAIDVCKLVFLLCWPEPSSQGTTAIFLITGLTGLSYGAVSTLLLAFYGVVFPRNLEAAYSNLYFWSFLGSMVMHMANCYFRLREKLIVTLSAVVVGIIGYLLTELSISGGRMQGAVQGVKHSLDDADLSRSTSYLDKSILVPAGF